MTGAGVALPLWAEIVVAALVLAGAAVALLGSFGMLRLKTFFERVHMPAIIATLGCWCVMWGTVLFFSVEQGGLAIFPLLTALFIAITVPIATIFLMRASLFRARQMGKDVPPSVSRTVRPAFETPDLIAACARWYCAKGLFRHETATTHG